MKRLFAIMAAALCVSSCSVMLHGDGEGIAVATAINISAQPPWGPAGYDCAPYYYFPDFNVYYDVNRALFHYYSRGRWISARALPPQAYPRDLYKFYKVVLTTRDPWLYNNRHRTMYKKYRGIHTQPVLRDSRNYGHGSHAAPDRRPQTPYRDDRNTIRNSRNNDTDAGRNTGRGSRRGSAVTARPAGDGTPSAVRREPANSRGPAGSRGGSRASERRTGGDRDSDSAPKRSNGSRGR